MNNNNRFSILSDEPKSTDHQNKNDWRNGDEKITPIILVNKNNDWRNGGDTKNNVNKYNQQNNNNRNYDRPNNRNNNQPNGNVKRYDQPNNRNNNQPNNRNNNQPNGNVKRYDQPNNRNHDKPNGNVKRYDQPNNRNHNQPNGNVKHYDQSNVKVLQKTGNDVKKQTIYWLNDNVKNLNKSKIDNYLRCQSNKDVVFVYIIEGLCYKIVSDNTTIEIKTVCKALLEMLKLSDHWTNDDKLVRHDIDVWFHEQESCITYDSVLLKTTDIKTGKVNEFMMMQIIMTMFKNAGHNSQYVDVLKKIQENNRQPKVKKNTGKDNNTYGAFHKAAWAPKGANIVLFEEYIKIAYALGSHPFEQNTKNNSGETAFDTLIEAMKRGPLPGFAGKRDRELPPISEEEYIVRHSVICKNIPQNMVGKLVNLMLNKIDATNKGATILEYVQMLLFLHQDRTLMEIAKYLVEGKLMIIKANVYVDFVIALFGLDKSFKYERNGSMVPFFKLNEVVFDSAIMEKFLTMMKLCTETTKNEHVDDVMNTFASLIGCFAGKGYGINMCVNIIHESTDCEKVTSSFGKKVNVTIAIISSINEGTHVIPYDKGIYMKNVIIGLFKWIMRKSDNTIEEKKSSVGVIIENIVDKKIFNNRIFVEMKHDIEMIVLDLLEDCPAAKPLWERMIKVF